MSLRIALVPSSYFPHVGGVEEHARSVASELVGLGHDVAVWTVDRGEHLGVQHLDGIEVRYLPTPLPARSASAASRFSWSFPPAAWQWHRAFSAFKPDVIHVHCYGPNGVYASQLARLRKTPLVFTGHGETFMDDHNVFDESVLIKLGLSATLKTAAAVTACSTVALEDLRRRFDLTGGSVTGNGVNPSHTSSVPRSAVPTILAVGRVEHTKGFDLLVRAFAEAQLGGTARLLIGGEGSALEELRGEVGRRGMHHEVSFLGRLSPDEVARQMAAAHIVVVPSRREAFGIVALEAWRAGTPLIATNRGGPAEFVTDRVNGLLVDPEDTTALAGCLTELLADPTLRDALSSNGRIAVLDYTWKRVAERYERVLTESVGLPA